MSRFLTAARSVSSFLWNSLRAAHTLVFGVISVMLIAALVIWRHNENIKRLLAHTEAKLGTSGRTG